MDENQRKYLSEDCDQMLVNLYNAALCSQAIKKNLHHATEEDLEGALTLALEKLYENVLLVCSWREAIGEDITISEAIAHMQARMPDILGTPEIPGHELN
jgi:hypothetical protein